MGNGKTVVILGGKGNTKMGKVIVALICFIIIFLALIGVIPFNGWTIAAIVLLLIFLIFG